MAKPIAGDRIVSATDKATVDRILLTIRTMESGGNYTALNKTASASGAYQMLNTTWKSWSTDSGVSGVSQYPRAYQAPPAMQDAVARWKVIGILLAYGGHLAAVPVLWYYPAAWGNDTILDRIPAPEAGNKLTVRQYAERWIKKYDTVTPSAPGSEGGVIDTSTLPDGVLKDVLEGNAGFTWSDVPVNSMLDAAKAAIGMVTAFGAALANPQTWIRILQVLGGTVLVGMGLWIVTHNTENMIPSVPTVAGALV